MKKRLDVLLVERGLVQSREKARALIIAGEVVVGEQKITKPGTMVLEETPIRIIGQGLKYVSRGGYKLEKALEEFKVSLQGKIVIDIGASTGGFTDCALQNGAKRVFAVDVGYGQLSFKLRQDPRVVVFERTNIRYFEGEKLPVRPDFATCDVSFISLKLVLPKIKEILVPDGQAIVLIKPQFEAGREKVGKKGVVKDPDTHREVIKEIIGFAKDTGFSVLGLTYSPITGPEGNIEYLLYLSTKKTEKEVSIDISRVVEEAFLRLNK
ncbi:TlyA family RNA methyltransferase [Carboxydothermus pertinax]|uniref:TlyA family rRNA (Cytidine-2'-O)-methyltransferase n=1 Tax=Carboxydothermus pertinax TaxID=870242 RepID=A0A1L8CTX8_9THEO|nr:TlyA family RNA methyltransferase [Carboxydothermus pertinax]GAV22357.1 TlyA family rRNA (cytidine-2'-O)-methyltransferase [Carboxydothermus pertinax]